MPCDSSYMNARPEEVESSKVRELIREVQGLPFNHKSRHDYYGKVDQLDSDTAWLCAWCEKNTAILNTFSLELQIWWRDHQEQDARREAAKAKTAHLKEVRRQALEKLTPEERRALGVKD